MRSPTISSKALGQNKFYALTRSNDNPHVKKSKASLTLYTANMESVLHFYEINLYLNADFRT